MMMDTDLLRDFMISVLDDDNGISEVSYGILCQLTTLYDIDDLLNRVNCQDDRYYINSNPIS
jgi:hypothetical protein